MHFLKGLIFICLLSSALFAQEEEIIFPDEELPETEVKKEQIQSEVNFGGDIKSQFSIDTREDNDNENTFESRNRIFVNLDFDATEKIHLYFSTKLDYNFYGNDDYESRFEGNIYEGYLELTKNKWDLRLGYQIVSWGKDNIIRPTDNINPLDLRGFIDPDLIDIKIPVIIAKWDYYLQDFNLELLYVPFFEETRFDRYGTDFSILRSEIFKVDIDDEMDSSLRQKWQQDIGVKEFPEDNLLEGDAGIKLTQKMNNLEASMSYLYAWEDYPNIKLDPELSQILEDTIIDSQEISEFVELTSTDEGFLSGSYKRQNIFGITINYNIENLLINMEGAYYDNKTFYTTELEPVRKPSLLYTIGIDFLMAINAHFFQMNILNMDNDLFLIDKDINGLSGFFRIPRLAGGVFFPELWAIYIFNNGDYFVSPRLRYKLDDSIELSLGGNIFEGDEGGLFESNLSPFGYFSQNDQVFLTFRYYF